MWFLVDKSGGVGLDDWEVKIAGFFVLLVKDAKKVLGPLIHLQSLRTGHINATLNCCERLLLF